jgi:cell division septum initiation protein DivIVA
LREVGRTRNLRRAFLAEGIEFGQPIFLHGVRRFTIAERSWTIDPDEISAARLPGTLIGGYKRGPTNDLLRRVAWDYRQVVYEGRALATAAEEFTRRIAELEAQVAQLGGTPEHGGNAENVATSVSVDTQRAAEELWAATRAECDAMLEQARAKSRQIEAAAALRSDSEASRLAELEQLRAAFRDELRSTVESLREFDARAPADGSEATVPRTANERSSLPA